MMQLEFGMRKAIKFEETLEIKFPDRHVINDVKEARLY